MNRIYQGRVSRAEIITDEKANPAPALEWDWKTGLWEHHALFQDAVNYYVVCLLALASGGTEKTHSIVELRDRITREPGTENPEDAHFYVWEKFRRRGAWRRGLRDSVAKYFTPGNDAPAFEDCAKAALAGNPHAETEEGRALLDSGLAQLLAKCTGDSGCRNGSKEFLPRFASPDYKGNYGEDTTTLARENEAARFPFVLHAETTTADSTALDEFRVHSIALPSGKKPEIKGSAAKAKLVEAVAVCLRHAMRAALQGRSFTRFAEMLAAARRWKLETAEDWKRLTAAIDARAADAALPGYAPTSAKGAKRTQLFAMFLFKYVERSAFTFNLLRITTRKPAADEQPPAALVASAGGGDPIRATRGARGYVFRAFTSLPCWGGDEKGVPEWVQFDFAAFCEALKALHQVEAKGDERLKERERKQARHNLQRDPKAKWKAGAAGEDGERPPVLFGDPRITRLESLLSDDKAAGGLAAEYEMSEGVELKYGLHPRTIRGFRDIRKKWNEIADKWPDSAYSEARRTQLWDALTDYKKENTETMGSPVLIDELVKEANWLLWRDTTPEQMSEWRRAASLPEDAEFAKDPLQALTDERELLADIERLKLPVRLTPADPEHSRRQFYFSDVSDLTKKRRLRHNQDWLDAEVALERDGKLASVSVRIHFTAPRLMRDQLTTTGDSASAWQQAMMDALGLRMALTKDGKAAEFAACTAVALMPEVAASGERRILLNFPVDLDALEIPKQLLRLKGRENLIKTRKDPLTKKVTFDSYWEKQTVASYTERKLDGMFHLRWPTTWHAEKADRKEPLPNPWWKEVPSFSCLSVDLGQRDAGAFAVIEAKPGDAPKPGISRKLGVAEGATWWATVRAMGLLRLPGEDAKVFRDGQWQEELSGERGRSLVAGEWDEACGICTRLSFDPAKLLGTDCTRHSFPELNGELLYALRRAQSRLARLQSWSCVAHDPEDESKRAAFEKRRKRIQEQITEAIAARAVEEAKDAKERGQELLARSAWLREVAAFVEKGAWDCVRDCLVREIAKEREIIQRELALIADRIQPLRGRRWEWVLREDRENSMLRQTDRGTDDRKKLLAGQRGLSIERIEQLESLRQRCQSLNRALRQTPGKPAALGSSKRGIELPDPCPELLDRLDALKEQRVNQTAHLILAQALGVRLRVHTTDAAERRKQDIHGEYERIPGREPVDFVVIENLEYYNMTQKRAKSTNARLMMWCRRQLRKKLIELCEPYGLRVLEAWPADTSKFCSLTGVAGFRAVELNPDDAKAHRWKKHLVRLQEAAEGKRKLDKDEREESESVRRLFAELNKLNADLLANRPNRPKWRTLLAPMRGGPIFVPMGGNPTQADINAAINIGLRAIAAPDADDIHVRIRAERKDGKFFVQTGNKREQARWGAKPPEIQVFDDAERNKLLEDARQNFFFDHGSVTDFDKARIEGLNVAIACGRGLWGTINGTKWRRGKDWQRVNTLNNNRLEAAGHGRPLEEEDDIP